MANNPTLDAMAEIHNQEAKENSGRRLALVVSLGAGESPQIEHDKVSVNVPNLSNLSAVKDLKDTVVGVTNLFEHHLHLLRNAHQVDAISHLLLSRH